MRFTPQHLERLKRDKKIVGYAEVGIKADNAALKSPSGKANVPHGLEHIKNVLRRKGLVYLEEYKFLTNRKFRFDICLPSFRLACEYEGLVATGKKGGHQTKSGYTLNCEKYNLAACEGWTVLRYTASNYKDFENNLIDFLTNKK